ncbi:MAG TPA: hypothetical protein VF528_11900 [Pyrinomonadaceae bacterium]|jgi:hypothetical protein
MKRCPTCQRTYEDDAQKFCANDGTPLASDDAPAFDPEATVMSIPRSSLVEEQPEEPQASPSSTTPELPPTQYFSPGTVGQSSRPEQSAPPSYPAAPPPQPPSPTPGASPSWPPAQQPQQQQQPYYPQTGTPGGQPPSAPQWQGGQPQQQNWTPPGQPPQGQNWGGGGAYYPQQQQPGQYAPQVTKSAALSLVTFLLGLISFIALAIIFTIGRSRSSSSDISYICFYVSAVTGFLALLLGIVTLISKRWRSKWMAILGALLSIPGILFFIYVVTQYGLP